MKQKDLSDGMEVKQAFGSRGRWTNRAARFGHAAAAMCLWLAACNNIVGAAPLGTVFTYQGLLNSGGAAVNGTADLTFTLYDAASGSNPVGTSNVGNDMWISNGVFTVALDFGPSAFNGTARWLEIAVRPGASTGAYTKLTPRQALTAAPFALYSANASVAPPGMALIPAGSFILGDALDGIGDASPVTATVSAFYMDINEVTLGQWKSVYHWAKARGYSFENPGYGESPHHPVNSVNWYDCVKWCNARSQQAGRAPVYFTDAGLTEVYMTGDVAAHANWSANGYRLPTEAEWERAARGGLSAQRFPWGNVASHELANYYGNTTISYDLGPNGYIPAFTTSIYDHSGPVGYFAPNGYGLNDMAGNIQEWCWDWYETPYAGGNDPRGPMTGTYKVIRGGSWGNGVIQCRVADRLTTSINYSDNWIGFRCILPSAQP
jgi:formylglycine-generating enzyme required for sulfatase activity